MLVTYRTLMCSAQPPLEQAGHPMAKREQVRANIHGFPYDLVVVAQVLQTIVPLPSVSLHLRARDNRFPDRRFKVDLADVRQRGQPREYVGEFLAEILLVPVPSFPTAERLGELSDLLAEPEERS